MVLTCFKHLEKYEFVNGKDDIPYMKWKIRNVPNYQPVTFHKLTENTTKIVCHTDPAEHHAYKMHDPSKHVIVDQQAETNHQNGERWNCEGLMGLQACGQNPKSQTNDCG